MKNVYSLNHQCNHQKSSSQPFVFPQLIPVLEAENRKQFGKDELNLIRNAAYTSNK